MNYRYLGPPGFHPALGRLEVGDVLSPEELGPLAQEFGKDRITETADPPARPRPVDEKGA